MARLEIDSVTVTLGGNVVLGGVSLDVADGECLALLGPSGCGKTTTLRAIAGFVALSAGDIRIAGRSVRGLPPHRRNLGIVFQDYALFPHMTVAENIGYGPRMRGLDRREIDRRADEALELVRLTGFGGRFPTQLSGGQRQRVALARALVVKPDMLLLDEPLGALDRKLRDHMQVELKRIQRELGVTSIIVTHDQEEALSLADRIAVMFDGQIREVGRPSQLYERPASRGVMDFLGDANFLDAEVEGVAAGAPVARTKCGIRLTLPPGPRHDKERVRIGIRPEHIVVAPANCGLENEVDARVTEVIYKGAHLEIYARTSGGKELTARQPVDGAILESLTMGAPVVLGMTARHLVVFQAEEEIHRS